MSLRRSGLQKEVIALYRRALRMVNTKPTHAQPKFSLFVRYTFRTQAASVSSREVAAIEHMLRRGRRQVEMYEDGNVRDCWVSVDMVQWGEQNKGRNLGSSAAGRTAAPQS
ncbi:Succinate dehydrogenase assembly factor 1A, mitochondrial [Grifola frondosa]|uniref:Succinate dehydrogenase assembly factor 1A, mitochondrial n=1 Tax=Grifola frondosa TaxID=5627 RepID=A0A1C7M4A8_GRIFR|nr:Succinate dehydrogenase assembly factor 1A, mitochondrial [Grifola frondosa]